MSVIKSAMSGISVDLLVDQSVDETTSEGIAIPSSFKQHKFNIKTSAGVASGAITLESANVADYSGIWNPITTAITVPAASSESEFLISGLFSAIRARISTVIGGGTVSVSYVGSH